MKKSRRWEVCIDRSPAQFKKYWDSYFSCKKNKKGGQGIKSEFFLDPIQKKEV